jgi:hypothetical protein
LTAEKKDGKVVGGQKMEKTNKSVYEIMQGIYQAAANGQNVQHANSVDFSTSEDKGDVLATASRNETFFVKVNANQMMLTYQIMNDMSDVLQKEKFLAAIKTAMAKVEKHLKSEYKKVTGKTLSISKSGEMNSMTQNISGTKCFTIARQLYTVSGVPEVTDEYTEEAEKTYSELGKVMKESWNKYIAGK